MSAKDSGGELNGFRMPVGYCLQDEALSWVNPMVRDEKVEIAELMSQD